MKPIRFKSQGHTIIGKTIFDPDWSEYQVIWTVDGSIKHGWTYYTDDQIDAVETLHTEYRRIKDGDVKL